MRKNFLLLLLLFPTILFAQILNNDTVKSSYKLPSSRPWILNTSLKPIFQPGSAWGICLKKDYKDGAFRFFNTFSMNNDVNYLRNNFNLDYTSSFGYEDRKEEGRWRIFYGADIRGELTYDYDRGNKKIYGYRVGASPFVGVSYHINKYLSLSSEVGVKMMLGKENNGYEIITFQKVSTVPYSNFQFDEVTEQIICLNYHF